LKYGEYVKLVPSSIMSVAHRAEPTGDISYTSGGRLPLLSTRPAVTFPAKKITPLAGTTMPNYSAW